jgi:hypothetical protein
LTQAYRQKRIIRAAELRDELHRNLMAPKIKAALETSKTMPTAFTLPPADLGSVFCGHAA